MSIQTTVSSHENSYEFSPPYCPNSKCLHHTLLVKIDEPFFCKYGRFRNGTGPCYQRFQCRECRHTFSEQSFRFSHRFKKKDPALSAKILKVFILGASNRAIANHFGISEHCVRKRLARMADWAYLKHRQFLKAITPITESFCYDGLENFAGSQYDPNYINQVIGQQSLFIYDFNFAPLNRKGRMSDRQKIAKNDLENEQGSYPREAIRHATTTLLTRILQLKCHGGEPHTLCSDEHYQYRLSVKKDLRHHPLNHVTVSGKATRNFQNILFPVNHADLLIRQRVAAFSRETIAFSKSHAHMCHKYMLFMVHKNYMAAQFTKKLILRPKAHVQSPAQVVGLTKKILKFHEFFDLKCSESCDLPEEWQQFRQNRVPYERQLRDA